MAGQGTMFLELYEDHPDMGAVIVPVGGGGMLRHGPQSAPVMALW
jgi:threonine dehydratase